jgi:hypothetical protein
VVHPRAQDAFEGRVDLGEQPVPAILPSSPTRPAPCRTPYGR